MLELLKQIPLLSQLPDQQLINLFHYIKHINVAKGTVIIEQDELGKQLYFIQEGTVHIELQRPSRVHIASLSTGAFFGEMSCLTGDPISASVIAVDNVSVIMLNRDGLLLLMEQSQSFRNHMIEAMVKRIQKSNERVAEEFSKSLYFMRRNELNDREKYGELVGASKQIESVRKQIAEVTAEPGVIIIYGEVGVGKTHVAKRIHYTSLRHTEPVITLSGKELNWSQWEIMMYAVGRGTLIVTNGEDLSNEAWRELLLRSEGYHVIVTTTAKQQLPNVRELHVPPLRERTGDIPVLASHYLSKENGLQDAISEEALRTLKLFPYLSGNVAELIAIVEAAYVLSEGRSIQASHLKFSRSRKPGVKPSIGLALGSGSIRGISHVGILHALVAEGIQIDFIAGTSAGSLVGGAYAAGMTPAELEKAVLGMKWNNIANFTFPKRSIFQNQPLIDYIESYLGDVQIEHLKIPFAAIASDTNTGEAHIMREGSLAKAIAASTAIPAVMRPVQHQGKTLIDGAVVHPVPAALVRSMGADIVIAVNVCTENFAKGVPSNFVKSLLNTIDMMSAKIVREELQLANIVIRPDLDHIVNGFKDAGQYIAAGEAAARSYMPTIRKQLEI